MPAAPTIIGFRTRAGVTLLEVLISCGLLIIGLATVASLLPAAGSLLTQATLEDRAAVLLSNATAEVSNRGLVAADVFPTIAGAGGPRTLALGKVLGLLPAYGQLPSGRAAAEYFAAPAAVGLKRCGAPRTFLLEDALVYDPSRVTGTPVNAFAVDQGGLGPRLFREGLCWGATLVPKQFPPRSGEAAVLSIAVFKREGDGTPGTAEDAIPVVLERVGSCYQTDALTGGPLLRGCSWVLAVPPSPDASPGWFKIMSSWTWNGPSGSSTRLILRDQERFATVTGAAAAGSRATVLVFEGIVRLDEQAVTLD